MSIQTSIAQIRVHLVRPAVLHFPILSSGVLCRSPFSCPSTTFSAFKTIGWRRRASSETNSRPFPSFMSVEAGLSEVRQTEFSTHAAELCYEAMSREKVVIPCIIDPTSLLTWSPCIGSNKRQPPRVNLLCFIQPYEIDAN